LVNLILILTGPIAAGKSALCRDLSKDFEFEVFKTHEHLKELAQSEGEETRRSLQDFGTSLDKKTNGSWVRDGLANFVSKLSIESRVIVDSARIAGQIESIRDAFGLRVLHVHLTAPDDVLERRFNNRRKQRRFREDLSYRDAKEEPTEKQVKTLAAIADVVINTKSSSEKDVVVRVASHLGLYGREYSRLVDVLIGGEYGSEGKGHIASYLAREYDFLIRVGGPNAGHKVIAPPYTFRLLPSGTRHSEAKLILGPGAVLNLGVLMKEIGDCEVDAARLAIDPQAMIIESPDIQGEGGLKEEIGSTGQGVGWATARRIIGRGKYKMKSELERKRPPRSRVHQIEKIPVRLARDIRELKPFVRSTYEELEKAFSSGKKILLEGTQGTALSIYHGMYPHVTSRDTTVTGCLAEAGISPTRVRKVVMVCRTYPIRVGGESGPMAQELSLAEISRRSGLNLKELRKTERGSVSNKRRRISEFDWSLIRRAASLNAPSDIAMSFVDYIDVRNKDARRFDQLTEETIRFIEEVEQVTTAPVSLISTRFHPRSIIDRRTW